MRGRCGDEGERRGARVGAHSGGDEEAELQTVTADIGCVGNTPVSFLLIYNVLRQGVKTLYRLIFQPCRLYLPSMSAG